MSNLINSKLPRVLKNFTAYVDGFGYAGKVSEIELPKLKLKTEDARLGGMDMPIAIDLGMEKLETTLTFQEYLPEIFKFFGQPETRTPNIVLRGAIGTGEEAVPVIVQLQGGFKDLDMTAWKPGDKGSFKVQAALTYYKLTIGEKIVVEIDVQNMKRIFMGIDQLEGQRKALGM